MNILLIRPNLGDYRSTDAMPPLAMGILAARSGGAGVRFLDEKTEPVPLDERPDLVGLSVETYTARRAYQIADHYRRRGVPVVMGGYHPTFLPEEALEHADAVVVGDAEGAWETLLADFGAGRLQRLYRGDNGASLDDFRVDRSIYSGKKYAPVELFQFGRGCRFACDFCSIHAFYGTTVRARPVDSLREEIERVAPTRLVFFVDDNLFGHRKDLMALLAMLKPLRLRWSCQISIDVARDDALLDAMAESGCRFVLIGFESLEPSNLRQMGKRWNNVSGDYRCVVRRLHERNIGVYGTFVFGYDKDTPATVARTVDFALDARLEIANFNPLTPTPGSALYRRLADEGRLVSPKWWLDPAYRYGAPIFRPARMSPQQLADGVFEARRRFYSWRSIASRTLLGEGPYSGFRMGITGLANVISRREIFRKQARRLGQ